MKTLFEKYKWLRIVLGATLLIAGVLTVIFQANGIGTIETIISIILAIICFLYGTLLIVTSLVRNTRTPFPLEIFIGGVFIGIGVTFLLPGVISSIALLIVYLVACGLIAVGALALVKAIIIICYKDPVQNWLFLLIAGAIALTGGILMLCYSDQVMKSVNYVIGVSIAVLGLFEIIYGVIVICKKKKK